MEGVEAAVIAGVQWMRLAAIAVIRTVLNYFLTHEMKEEVQHPELEEAVR
jgi:uncharacterized membrane protein